MDLQTNFIKNLINCGPLYFVKYSIEFYNRKSGYNLSIITVILKEGKYPTQC